MTTTSKTTNPEAEIQAKATKRKGTSKPKRAVLIEMLKRRSGADIAAISTKLGWQPHTTRAALSRLRKSGFEITSEKPGNGKPSRYRIIEGLAK